MLRRIQQSNLICCGFTCFFSPAFAVDVAAAPASINSLSYYSSLPHRHHLELAAARKQQQRTVLHEEDQQEDPHFAIRSSRQPTRQSARDTALVEATLQVESQLTHKRKLAEIFPNADAAPPVAEQEEAEEDASHFDFETTEGAKAHLQLSKFQRRLLQEKRSEEYSILRRNFLKTMESHHDLIDKCHLLSALHHRLASKQMRLHDSVYEDFFATFVRYGNAAQMELRQKGLLSGSSSSSSAPGMRKLNDFGFTEVVWEAFQYMLASRAEKMAGIPPPARVFQHVMRCLQLGSMSSSHAVLEERAHFIMVEIEKYGGKFAPTMPTVVSYVEICASLGKMHIAMAAYVHSRSEHQMTPTPALCSVVINGFLKNDDVESAVHFISNMTNVAIDQVLFNTILNAMRHSQQPLAAFAAFRTTISDPAGGANALGSSKTEPVVRNSTTLPVTEENITTLLHAWWKAYSEHSGAAAAAAAAANNDSITSSRPSKQKQKREFLRLAAELQFLLQTTVAHRVKCGEHALNDLLEALQSVELTVLGEEQSVGTTEQAKPRLRAIHRRCVAHRGALVKYMQQRGVRIHQEKVYDLN